jgi:uncharacterized membrane protein YqgA involved in biofilm formation
MLGTIVNTAAVAAGSGIGLLIKKALPERYETIYFQAVGLFTLLLGIKMAAAMTEPMLVVLSLVLGGFAGVRLRLTRRVEGLGRTLQRRMRSSNDRFTEGLTTGFLLFCIGPMTIAGCIEEGFGHAPDVLLTKSLMDFFSAVMLGAALGTGILFSALPLLLFQGGVTLLVSLAGRDIPPAIVDETIVTGGIIMIGLSLSLLKIKQIDILNLLPALILIGLFIYLRTIV